MEVSELTSEFMRDNMWALWEVGRPETIAALRELADYWEAEQDIKAFDCMDCGFNTMFGGEYYGVSDDLWESVVPDRKGMLCIGCLETRIGRVLVKDDFLNLAVNDTEVFGDKSERLQNRMGITC